MRAAIFNGPCSIEVGTRPDPVITAPTDAVVRVVRVVRVVLGCVCGSDLWYYRSESPHAVGSIGHEFIGVVEAVGSDVRGVAVGDLAIAPFIYSDGTCPHCQALEGRINPGRVFDYETNLDGIADAYTAMDERRAIKSLVRVGGPSDDERRRRADDHMERRGTSPHLATPRN